MELTGKLSRCGIDANYESLRSSRDVESIRARINAMLARAGDKIEIEALRLAYSFYVPGKNYRAVYEAEVKNGVRRESQLWFGRLMYSGDSQVRYEKAQRKLANGRFVQPQLGHGAYHLEDLGLVFWIFPNDPNLKMLRELMKPEVETRILSSMPQFQDRRIGNVERQLKRYIPSKRVVFRYEVEVQPIRGQEPSGEKAKTTLYAKNYDSEAAARHSFENIKTLFAKTIEEPNALRVPEPLSYDPDLWTLWLRELPGRHLMQQIENLDEACMQVIGQGLAVLHQTSLELAVERTFEDELADTRKHADIIVRLFPQFGGELEQMMCALEEQMPRLPRIPLVPTHGTFKLNHLIGDAAGMGLVDFDSMVLADPLFDLGNFISDLYYQEAHGCLPSGQAEWLGRTFQDAYFSRVPWGRRQRALDWYVTSLLIRKQAYKPVKHLHDDAQAKIAKVIEQAAHRTRRLIS